MKDSDHPQDFEHWRQKYYATLEKAEAKQHEWESLEKMLRRCISRLALAADGMHPDVDVQLESLRKAVRDGVGPVGLQERIEAISQILLKLDLHPAVKARKTDHLDVSIAPSPGSASEPASGGFFGKLFGGNKQPAKEESRDLSPALPDRAPSAPPPSPHKVPPKAPASTSLDTAARPRPQDAKADTLSPAVREAVVELLERLTLQPEMTDSVEALKVQLSEETQALAFLPSLQSVAGLVAATLEKIRSEKSDLEAFLRMLTQRLQEIDQHLSESIVARQAAQHSHAKFDLAVNDQVSGIETSMQEAVDISSLKQVIQLRLEGIREHMTVFRREEEEREKEAQRQVGLLSSRVREMETEIGQLHTRVRTEQANSLQDALTSIPNRLAYERRSSEEFARWRRYNHALTLLVLDIDHFKRVNDRYGHQAGDKVLRIIAQLLKKEIRDVDFMGRYGGEEFVMLLPETALEGARIVAEKLCACVRDCEFHHGGQRVPITISCGIAVFKEGDTVNQAFERADAALYRCKLKGRDQWQDEI
jgi:diguanylate cyclase